MKKIYCISGLGADEKAFSRIRLPGYQLECLPWLTPEANEPIAHYANRMAALIPDEKPLLMGLSFGGMMCIEIAKIKPAEKIILISSIPTFRQLPVWMRWAGKLRLHTIVPLNASSTLLQPVQDYHIGAVTKEEKEIVRRYRKNVEPHYLKWAINAVLQWKNERVPCDTIHIHGDADRIFPVKMLKPDHIVKGGSHFMIFSCAHEINACLTGLLNLPNHLS